MRNPKMFLGLTACVLAVTAAITVKAKSKATVYPSYYIDNWGICEWGPFTHCVFNPIFFQRCIYLGKPLYTDDACSVPAYYNPM